MTSAKDIFFMAVSEIKLHYPEYGFMVNRDLAWILQKKMNRLIEENGVALELYHDYPLEKGCRERKDDELVIVLQGTNYRDILGSKSQAELVIRVLFEPSKKRSDICNHHLPRILITQLTDHIEKTQSIVQSGRSKEAICLLIDEYSRHRHQIIQNQNIIWTTWGNYDDSRLNVSTLLVQYT